MTIRIGSRVFPLRMPGELTPAELETLVELQATAATLPSRWKKRRVAKLLKMAVAILAPDLDARLSFDDRVALLLLWQREVTECPAS